MGGHLFRKTLFPGIGGVPMAVDAYVLAFAAAFVAERFDPGGAHLR